jgi:pyruvate dehydrogenase E2 component (dihydrolipoamide acetyltransferase)
VTEFKVPELGENVDSGDVTQVLVKVGDTIAREQPVLELETDKATIEVPSSVAGVVKDIRVKAGEKIKVGQVVLVVDGAGAAAGGSTTPAPAAAAQSAGDDATAADDAAGDADSVADEGADADAGVDDRQASAPTKVVHMPAPVADAAPAAGLPARRDDAWMAPAAPSVRRLAREIGVDIAEVPGSGPDGRISMDDVKAYAKHLLAGGRPAAAAAPGGAAHVPLPDFAKWGPVERQPMSNIRRKTAEHLGHAWNTIPHVTQFDKADITAMEELRRKYRQQVTEAGGNLTVTAMLVKVLATAVQRFPQFNASLDPAAGQIVYKKYVHIGVAADTEWGLLVPVIRDADRKNITQIAVEVHQAAEKARARKLTLDDMSGGGMTISNLGGLGGTYFTPIVNWPEVAILGVSRGIVEPVWNPATSAFEPRQLLPLSLSYDHRVIDGADAVRFLRWVVEAIEQPFLLSLHG